MIDVKDQPRDSYFRYDITDDLGEHTTHPEDYWQARGSGLEWPYAVGVILLFAVLIFIAFWQASA